MKSKQKNNERTSVWFKVWFALTPMERLLLASALAVFMIGLAARHFYLKNAVSKPYDPVKTENTRGMER